MSCLMYQPYATYFPYQRGASGSTANYSESIKRFHTPLEKSSSDGLHNSTCSPYGVPLNAFTHSAHAAHASHTYPGPSLAHHHPSSTYSSGASLPQSPANAPLSEDSLSALAHLKQERLSAHALRHETTGENQPKDTKYLSANCVLLTYVSGDTARNVDEHFARSLGGGGGEGGGGGGTRHGSIDASPSPTSAATGNRSDKTGGGKSVPMSQRNLPASFWNAHYQAPAAPPSAAFTNFTTDAYFPALHSMTSLTQDPWRYPFSSQAHSYTHSYAHPSLADFTGYGPASATSRFNSQFPSFMPGAAAAAAASKLGTLGQYELGKHVASDTWAASRYHADAFGASAFPGAHQDPYSLYAGTLSGTC